MTQRLVKKPSQTAGRSSVVEAREEQIAQRKGDWTEQEHQAFLEAIITIGVSKWKQISSAIKTRQPGQCQIHFYKLKQKLGCSDEEFIEYAKQQLGPDYKSAGSQSAQPKRYQISPTLPVSPSTPAERSQAPKRVAFQIEASQVENGVLKRSNPSFTMPSPFESNGEPPNSYFDPQNLRQSPRSLLMYPECAIRTDVKYELSNE